MNWLASAEFWTAVLTAVVVVISYYLPDLRDTLTALVPLLVAIILAIVARLVVRELAGALVQTARIRAQAEQGRGDFDR